MLCCGRGALNAAIHQVLNTGSCFLEMSVLFCCISPLFVFHRSCARCSNKTFNVWWEMYASRSVIEGTNLNANVRQAVNHFEFNDVLVSKKVKGYTSCNHSVRFPFLRCSLNSILCLPFGVPVCLFTCLSLYLRTYMSRSLSNTMSFPCRCSSSRHPRRRKACE